jgi:hypothetical protein
MAKPVFAEAVSEEFPSLRNLCEEIDASLEINKSKLNIEMLKKEISGNKKAYQTTPSPSEPNPACRSRLSDELLAEIPSGIQDIFKNSPGFEVIRDSDFIEQSFCDLIRNPKRFEAIENWPELIHFFQKFAEIYVIKRMQRPRDANELVSELQSLFDSLMQGSSSRRQKDISQYFEEIYRDLSPRYQIFFTNGATYSPRSSWNLDNLTIKTDLRQSNPDLYQALKDQMGDKTLSYLLDPNRRESVFLNGQYALSPRREQDTRHPEMIGRIEFYSQDRGYQGKTAVEIELESHWQQALKSFDRLNYIYGISDEQQKELLVILDLMKRKEIENLDLAEQSLNRSFGAAAAAPVIAPLAMMSSGVSLFILGIGLGVSAYTAHQESLESPVQEKQGFGLNFLNALSRDAPDLLIEVGMWAGIAQAVRWGGRGISKAGYAKTGKLVTKYGEWAVVVPMIAFGLSESFADGDQGHSTEAESAFKSFQSLLSNEILADPCDLSAFDKAEDKFFDQRLSLCEWIDQEFPDGFDDLFGPRPFIEIAFAIWILHLIENSPVGMPVSRNDLESLLHQNLGGYQKLW